jgi:hypothetical protein
MRGPLPTSWRDDDALPSILFGTIKRMMAGGRFLTRNLKGTRAEMALSILAYNMLRAINIKATTA